MEICYIFYTYSTFLLEPATLQVWLQLLEWTVPSDPSGKMLLCHSAGNIADQLLEEAPFRHQPQEFSAGKQSREKRSSACPCWCQLSRMNALPGQKGHQWTKCWGRERTEKE